MWLHGSAGTDASESCLTAADGRSLLALFGPVLWAAAAPPPPALLDPRHIALWERPRALAVAALCRLFSPQAAHFPYVVCQCVCVCVPVVSLPIASHVWFQTVSLVGFSVSSLSQVPALTPNNRCLPGHVRPSPRSFGSLLLCASPSAIGTNCHFWTLCD